MLTILVIDDQQSSVDDVIDLLEEHENDLGGVETARFGFEEGKAQISVIRPDVIVLDIWNGAVQASQTTGTEIFELVWEERFCPVVVYSADPEMSEVVTSYNNPFVKFVQKGSDSDEKVLRKITALAPHVESLREAMARGEEILSKSFHHAMKEVAPYAFANFFDTQERMDTILRAGRRRVAASMDEPLQGIQRLAAWEQYLSPPVSSDPQLGDILKVKDGDSEDPGAFRVVLTPSCDMVASNSRTPKVSEILVATCCSVGEGLKGVGLTIGPNGKDLSKETILTQGYQNSIIMIPGLQGKIPTMAANLRELELIKVDRVIGGNPDFVRMASVDSPFRELISWAYLQVSCRPGLPDRDLEAWSNEINNAISKQTGDFNT